MEDLNGIKRPSETNSSSLTALIWNISVLPTNQDTNMTLLGSLGGTSSSTVIYKYKMNWGFPAGENGKEPNFQCRRHKRSRFDPWVGKIPGEGTSYPFQYSCLENPMDRVDWWTTIYRVTNSRTPLKQLNTHAQDGLGLITLCWSQL